MREQSLKRLTMTTAEVRSTSTRSMTACLRQTLLSSFSSVTFCAAPVGGIHALSYDKFTIVRFCKKNEIKQKNEIRLSFFTRIKTHLLIRS